jgi:hypothetical protein
VCQDRSRDPANLPDPERYRNRGAKYFIMITNDFSRYRKIVSLKYKDEAEKVIQEFITKIKAKEYRIEAIRKDGGTEFRSKKFEK